MDLRCKSHELRRDRRVVIFGAPTQFVGAGEEAQQRVLECVSKVPIEVSIDEGVEGRVEVTDPENQSDESVRTLAFRPTKRRDHVPVSNNKVFRSENSSF